MWVVRYVVLMILAMMSDHPSSFSCDAFTPWVKPATHTCPDTWRLRDGYCYKYYSQEADFTGANAICETYGSTLTSVLSKKEYDTVIELAHQTKRFWIGLKYSRDVRTDKHDADNWMWIDGSQYNYRGWAPSQPLESFPNEVCAFSMDNGLSRDKGWHDVRCWKKFSFVCKKPASYKSRG